MSPGVALSKVLSTSRPHGNAVHEDTIRLIDEASKMVLLHEIGESLKSDNSAASRCSNGLPAATIGWRPLGMVAGSSGGRQIASIRRAAATKSFKAEPTCARNDDLCACGAE